MSAFHAGEQALQERVGSRERLERGAPSFMRDHMPDQHRELFNKLPTLLLGALDAQGQPWATMLGGAPGFVSTPDARQMHIRPGSQQDDPVLRQLTPGAAVGVLGLEPHTRRRNRMNGRIEFIDDLSLNIEVLQSFGNCPKYIQAREPLGFHAPTDRPAAQALGSGLDATAVALIRASDTLFIASASAARPGREGGEGVDVSHRGGEPGFVQIEQSHGETVLTLPDYPGNQFFNTLGNLNTHPLAGLLFVDYARGDLLHLAARAEVLWPQDAPFAFHRWPGAQRLLRLRVSAGLWRPAALPWRWSEAQPAPQFQLLRAGPPALGP
ncbi:MAG: pyridoxamine 5'-phosphate oxidase family protein [Burkholderiaceae bacterium]|nr:pyridoxamine 5'-phosphate oxidase family protein [Burkholderiaceae bacterium]